jgi:hypothetical protein
MWFYYSKSTLCCQDVRAALGCTAALTDSCIGFVGTCAGLLAWPATAAAFEGQPFQCTEFPVDGSARDQALVGLICFAVSLPVTFFMSQLFSLSTSTDNQILHGRTRWLRWAELPLVGHLFGFIDWRSLSSPDVSLAKRTRMYLAARWSAGFHTRALSGAVDACLLAPIRAARRRRAGSAASLDASKQSDAGVDPLTRALDESVAAEFDFESTFYKRMGYAVMYASWAIFAWIIIAFGRLIYNLQGPASENTFIKAWCIGIGIGQAQEWTYVARTALEAAVVLTVADLLWLAQDELWFEGHMDWLSVYWSASSFATAGLKTTLAGDFYKAFHFTKAIV